MVNLRLATMADSDRLLAWRNDPETIANSLSSEPVAPEIHAEWMQRWVCAGFPMNLVLIAEYDNRPIGTIRFAATARWTYEVSITIAPAHRGRGWGAKVLAAGCAPMGDCELVALIKVGNHASRTIFEHNRFTQIAVSDGIAKYRRERCSPR